MSKAANLVFNNRYLTLKELGCGGFGCTYLAIDTHMPSKPKCVVKQLTFETDDPDLLELVQTRFQREGAILEILGSLSPQIPRLHACSQEGNNLYLVQDWVDGESLQERLNKKGALGEDEVNDLLAYILPVLGIVHSKYVIHRDIKPANIMVRNEDGKPVLIDFGAVKEAISMTAGMYGNTQLSIVIGTPGFAPAEQLGGNPVFASDIYSLGMTAICLLTGKSPSWKETDLDTGRVVWKAIRPGTWYPYAAGVSNNLKSVLDKAIQPSAVDRFRTAREMQNALRLKRSPTGTSRGSSAPTGLERLMALAQKYNDIRKVYKGRDTRNRRELMMGVLNEMIKLGLEEDNIDVTPYLEGDDWGMRLAAYAYIYTHPELRFLSALVSSAQQAGRQPFVQHRGIEAIEKILEAHSDDPLAKEAVKGLRTFLRGLRQDTLRHAELSRILKNYNEGASEDKKGDGG
jgi:serine/threonine-protein kinase